MSTCLDLQLPLRTYQQPSYNSQLYSTSFFSISRPLFFSKLIYALLILCSILQSIAQQLLSIHSYKTYHAVSLEFFCHIIRSRLSFTAPNHTKYYSYVLHPPETLITLQIVSLIPNPLNLTYHVFISQIQTNILYKTFYVIWRNCLTKIKHEFKIYILSR